MLNDFFKRDEFFIDEKVLFLRLANEYKVFDNMGVQIGLIRQQLTSGQKVLKLLLSNGILPFRIEIYDNEGRLLSSIERGWTFWMSKITVNDQNDMPIGSIKQKFKLMKPEFKIYNNEGGEIGSIKGDLLAWNFTIFDTTGNQIGLINKKWSGAAREIFTTADKYNVSIEPSVSEDQSKMIILSAAITIDMVLKEQNRN